MKKTKLLLIASLFGITGFAQTLDQENFGGTSTGWQIDNANYTSIGQGFKSGLTGQLAQVRIELDNTNPVYPPIAGTSTITIFSGLGFGGTVLGSTTFTTNGSENGEFTINVSAANVNVVAGNDYTFRLSNSTGRVSIINATNDNYSFGALYYTIGAGGQNTYGTGDLKFRTFVNPPAPGKNLGFDGMNDFVNLGTGITNIINTSQSFTLEAWFKTPVSTTGSHLPIVGNHQNNTHVDLRIENNKLVTFIGFGAIGVSSTANIALNTWYHGAVTLNNDSLSLYLNGVLVASTPRNGFNLPISTTPYMIGGDFFAGRMNGEVDEVRIYNYAVSSEDILRRMNCEIDPATSGLIAYYKLNQGVAGGTNTSINTATDATANGFNGSLTGFALTGATSNWVASSPITSGDVIPAMPTTTTSNVVYCFNETASPLVATGTNLRWFTSAVGGVGTTTLTPATNTAGTTSFWVAATNASGCESERLEITVEVLPEVTGTDIQTACGSFDWIDGNTYSASTNTAVHTIVGGAVNGCDSIVTLDLTIIPVASGVDVQTACGSFDWIDGNTYSASNNTATHTIVGGAENGCDSIVTLNLTIQTVPTMTATDNNDLTITASTATSYQWINCATGQAIAGETNQIFTATANGNYAVVGTSADGCSDTSACVLIDYMGLDDQAVMQVSMAPNPTSDLVVCHFSTLSAVVNIRDAQGKMIDSKQVNNGQQISLKALNSGIYFFEITSEQGRVVKRIVKE